MADDYVKETEFERYCRQQNGKTDRVLNNQEETFCLLRTQGQQMTAVLERTATHSEQIGDVSRRLGNVETCVQSHETKLKMPGWLWKGSLGLAVFALTILNIVMVAKVL